MSLILTNDDGIDAPGIQALLKAVEKSAISSPVIIAAPQEHLSGCGHQVTTVRPLTLQRRDHNVYAIAGTPADCVRLSISHICPDVKWVLSGINAGGNMGVDSYISGTVAAVREATMHGIKGIAISQYKKKGWEFNWDNSVKWTTQILTDLLNRPLPLGSFWNVNLPHLSAEEAQPEVVFCRACTKPLPVNYRTEDDDKFYYIGEYAQREKTPGSDVEACFSGKIAVTQLTIIN
ncbi:MAG: 5'/3'-nucleotidase SurE [Richelia sp. RM2_1_2]|nr:5'/3'-nucleotidase SurE [Richelia sp. SM2_1_7]NJM21038.1 5'/3'-nucleotidase SurE [Richelia sp. SM1_7_0]NJN08544.1 5'/3'-nucleotidase SurE [Richelia sp. RM1_1_1]NJO57287.1 5'/3'-nucleotidase SurE [Richelia sp. RM2_1_2]